MSGAAHVLVERPGMLTTVQDCGRHGWQHVGVVPSGAMDCASLQLANALVGNSLDLAGLEITLRGPTLLFQCDGADAGGGAGSSGGRSGGGMSEATKQVGTFPRLVSVVEPNVALPLK